MLTHDYEHYRDAPFFSFIALWKYAEEGNFFDHLFRTQWKSFMVMYIELQKTIGFKSSETLQEYNQCRDSLQKELLNGEVEITHDYQQLLEYLSSVINMVFETHTFKMLLASETDLRRGTGNNITELKTTRRAFEHELTTLDGRDRKLNTR